MDISVVHPEVLKVPKAEYPRRVVAYVLDIKRGGGQPPHSHNRAQLLVVTSGSIAVTAEGSTFVAPPERAIWVPADTVHETRHLASTRLHTLYVEAEAVLDLPAKTTVIQVTSLMRELINAIVVCPRLYIENGADGRLVSVLLDQLAVAQALPLHLSMPKSDVLLSVATRILEAPADLQPVEDLASSLGMSSRTLERRFKTEAGHSLRSFRRQAKLLRALELLSTDMSVSDISDTLGFGDPSAFIAMFRSALGVTPGRYLSEGLAPKKMSAVQNEQRKAGRRAEH